MLQKFQGVALTGRNTTQKKSPEYLFGIIVRRKGTSQ